MCGPFLASFTVCIKEKWWRSIQCWRVVLHGADELAALAEESGDNTATSTITCATVANSPNGLETGNGNIIRAEFNPNKQKLQTEKAISKCQWRCSRSWLNRPG